MAKKKITVDYPFFKVVADGAVSSVYLGEGRLIPSIIIDIENNVEIAELLKLHDETPPGDIELFWSLRPTIFSKPKTVLLSLKFSKPMLMSFGIEFSLSRQHHIVDGIIQARSFFLQVGKSGDKVSTVFTDKTKRKINGCILVEVPNLNFDVKWNELFLDALIQNYREHRVAKKDATTLAKKQIIETRKLWAVRRQNDN